PGARNQEWAAGVPSRADLLSWAVGGGWFVSARGSDLPGSGGGNAARCQVPDELPTAGWWIYVDRRPLERDRDSALGHYASCQADRRQGMAEGGLAEGSARIRLHPPDARDTAARCAQRRVDSRRIQRRRLGRSRP